MEFEEEVVTEGLSFRTRVALLIVAVVSVGLMLAPVALAQSPDDLPDFDQLPLPGGDEPSEDPTDAPGGGGGGDTGNNPPQVDAPGGGVDTGAGGLADRDVTLPLAAAAALASMGGAALVARRRAVRG